MNANSYACSRGLPIEKVTIFKMGLFFILGEVICVSLFDEYGSHLTNIHLPSDK